MQKVLWAKNKKINKKGFTLVELLVCVAIMAVIALLLAQFVASTTGAYRRSSSTTKVQETTQDVLNQISNIVRNSKSLTVTVNSESGGITMQSVNYENKNVRLVYVPDIEENDYGRIYVCYDYVIPTPEPGEEIVLPDITANEAGERYNDYLLCDMVKGFTVGYAKYVSVDDSGNEYERIQERTLDMVLTLERNGRDFTQKYKASLRNSSPEGQTSELKIQFGNEDTNTIDE